MPSDAARGHSSRAGAAHLDNEPPIGASYRTSDDIDHSGKRPASSSARLKDVADSYLRQLYGGNTATRVLGAQGLGALPSFLPPSQASDALRRAIEMGVVGSLTDVLLLDDEMPVQEACVIALGTLLLSTAPHEDHSAPVRAQHLKLLGATVLRPEVMTQIGYLLNSTANTRVILAAARVVSIIAPYITQANDIYILESRIVPALLAAAASRPDTGADGYSTGDSGDGHGGASAVATGAVMPRDGAVCVLALLTLAQSTPDLYHEIRTADFLQAVCVLYERCIDPNQTSDVILPADAAALLLRATNLSPNPRWLLPRLPAGHARTMERNLLDSHVLDCMVSFVAVESGNLRRLGEDLSTEAEGNAAAIIEKNNSEIEQLQAEMRERRKQLAEARVTMQDALRKLEAAEGEAARKRREAEAAIEYGKGTPEHRQVRQEAEAEAAAAAASVEERRRGMHAAEAAVEGMQEEVATLRRAVASLRWQNERMARLQSSMQAWREQYGFKAKSKVKLSRPNTAMLTQVLTFLEGVIKAGSRSGAPAVGSPSREHVAALHAKLLEAGMVQAMVQLLTVMLGVRSLAEELAALVGDLALQPDMSGALEGAATQLRKEASGLSSINRRAEVRLQQVYAEATKLRRALKLELPLPEGSPLSGSMELGPGNGLSRTVRQEDVQQRLEALDAEADDLVAALGDSEALVDFLQDKVQAVEAACLALSDSYAAFAKAFPSQAAPATPATAPVSSGRNAAAAGHTTGNGQPNGDSDQPHNTSLRLASRSIISKDPTHPGGHLLGILSRALAPVARGSALNVPALVRQLLGRTADGAGSASWPPMPATRPLEEVMANVGATASPGRPSSASNSRSKSVGSAPLAAGRPNSAGTQGMPAARPSSARSAGAGPYSVERSNSIVSSFRGSGGFGLGFGKLGYGGGFGGFGGFPNSGPFPTDGKGRPMRYPKESMYGIIQATFSPMRGYSIPHNGPRLALLLREKSLLRISAVSATAANRGSHPNVTPRTSATITANGNNSATAPAIASELTAPELMPLVKESHRVVHQVVSSVLFDPIDADVLGPDVVPASTASLMLTDGVCSRPLTAHSRRDVMGLSTPPPEASQPERPATPQPEEARGNDMSVLDALLMQSELLCGVMTALATLVQFSKSTIRTCRHLPATVSYASLQPGALGPYMARLHANWATAIAQHPEMRVQIAGSVAEIAHLALVPGSDFQAVYRSTGIVEMLVQMLASGLRPAKADAKAGDGKAGAGGEEAVKAGPTGLKSRYVGRLTATAPPTLRAGPVQQVEQAAAGQALRAISQAQSEVLASIAQDDKLLARLSRLVLDHSMSWPARQAAADLLSDLVLGGGPGAEAAVASGAYAGLVEMLNRDMYPFLNQDPRGSKETVVSALACLVAHPELLEGVVEAAKANHGASSGLPLSSAQQVMFAILRSLWRVVWQVYSTYTSNRTGHGRYVDPDLISALTSTAATAARELAVLADTVTEARRMMINEMKLSGKINATFLQAIKDPPLHESLLELRKNLI